MSTACYAQPYGNGPQYSTPAEQARTRDLNEQAISGTTQSPAVLNGEAPPSQSGGYGAPNTDQSSGYSSGQSPAAEYPPNGAGYYGEPSSAYGNQQQPGQNYGNPPNTSPGYYTQPSGTYGNPPNSSPGYYVQPPSPPANNYYEPPTTNYGNPQSSYPYGPSPNSDNRGNKAPHYAEQNHLSNSQLRYEDQLAQYREQQAQYRRAQLHYRAELSAYGQAMDEWYNPVPYEEYP
jgi:hypothetical protein